MLENVDWQFVKSMDEVQIFGEEFASQTSETDLFRSIRAGRSFSRESLAASARTEQAEARTGQALGLLLPSVTIRANYGSETSAPSVELDDEGNPIAKDTHDRTDVAWTVRQPLFDLPAFLDWRRRQVIEQASRENYRVSDGDAYIATTNAYLTLVSTRVHTDLTRDFEAQLAELLSYIEKRAKGGAASFSDMARVRARSQETLSFRLEQEAAHEAAGIDFVRLTNLVPGRVRLPEFADIGAESLPKTFSAAIALAMKKNPEIAGITAEVKAASIDKSAAKSQFLPRLDAEYTDTYSQHAGGDTSSDGQRDKRGMLVLSWSPLNGGRDYEFFLERTARHKELQYRLDDERRRVVQAISSNYSTLAITGERINSGYRELRSISLAVEAMSKRMLSGNQSLLDLLDVYDRFYQARSRLVDLHILEMFTMAQLVRLTTGTPWMAPDQATAPPPVEQPLAPAVAPPVAKGREVAASSKLQEQEEPTVEVLVTPDAAIPAENKADVPEPITSELVPEPLSVDFAPEPKAGVVVAPPAVVPVAAPESEPVKVAEQAPARASEVVDLPEAVVIPAVQSPQVKTPESSGPSTSATPAAEIQDIDDAYAPLWLDIIPRSGTALAEKNRGEAVASAGFGVAPAAVAVRPASADPVTSATATLSLGLLDTEDQAKIDRLVAEVEGRLGQPVRVQLFASEEILVNWFQRLRAVDMVVIPVSARGDLLAGNYALLQELPRTSTSASRERLVARRDLSAGQRHRLEQAFGAVR